LTSKGAATLIDKLDTGVPRLAEYTRSFGKLVELSMTPDWHKKVWRDGGHYLRRGDFREISGGELPVIVHQHNRHDRRAGDKMEIVETGNLSMIDLVSIQQQVYRCDAEENRVMRVDLCSDVEGAPVSWYRDNTQIKQKQVHREWAMQTVSKRNAETLTAGQKPNQLRIYDKTRHREMLLAKEIRRLPKDSRDVGMSFEDRWGYDRTKVVTRIERQVGGAGIKNFGFAKVGHLWELAKTDPFIQIVFPDDVTNRRTKPFKDFRDTMSAAYLRELAERDGVQNARSELWRLCENRYQFYRAWNKYKEFILPTVAGNVTRQDVMASYRASINHQLLRAA